MVTNANLKTTIVKWSITALKAEAFWEPWYPAVSSFYYCLIRAHECIQMVFLGYSLCSLISVGLSVTARIFLFVLPVYSAVTHKCNRYYPYYLYAVGLCCWWLEFISCIPCITGPQTISLLKYPWPERFYKSPLWCDICKIIIYMHFTALS